MYLDTVKQANRVFLMSGQATTVLVTTTIFRVGEEEGEGLKKVDTEKDCLTSLMMSACKCLPWMSNSQVQKQPCVGGDKYNCSQTVGGLLEAAGGDSQLARVMVEQRMRVSLPAGVRDKCRSAAAGNRVQHSVRQVGGGG